jgi:hypothetical protein
MSVIHIGHIERNIVDRFSTSIDLSDVLTASPQQRDVTIRTRSLAAFVVAEIGGAEDAAAAAAVVDGSGDNGIDAVYYDSASRTCLLVQTKWIASGNGSVEVGDVLKFVQGIRDVLAQDFAKFNNKLTKHKDSLQKALFDSSARFSVVLAYTGEQDLSADARRPLDDLVAEMNSPTEMMGLRILGQAALHEVVAEGVSPSAVNLEIMLQDWGMLDKPCLAYYGKVAVEDIGTWSLKGTELTSKNLRQFRGLTDVNEGITRTLSTTPELFWYFNNGITVLCEELRKKPLGGSSNAMGSFDCTGASVVNGAQTVGVIGEIAKTGKLAAGATVLVRLVSLENAPTTFSDDLTRATNTQNRIEKRDFAALDPNQKRLKTELYLENQKVYAYQTGDATPSPEDGCTLDEAAVALACKHPNLALAVQAKREVGMLYDDIGKAPYTSLFNPQLDASAMWRAVVIMRVIDRILRAEQELRTGREQLVTIHGNRFISHLVFQALRNEASPTEATIRTETVAILGRVTDCVLSEFSGAYPASLFKNLSKCRDLAALAGNDPGSPQTAVESSGFIPVGPPQS